jgi:hypothetical protein
MCNLFLNMCIVGLVQTAPNAYLLQTITDSGVIRSFTVHEDDYCHSFSNVLPYSRRSPELSRSKWYIRPPLTLFGPL